MANSKGEGSPEHIEELLSQLKGIFGHLSESEQEEAKRKITPPAASASVPTPTPVPKEVTPAVPDIKLEATPPAPEPAPLQDPFGSQALPSVEKKADAPADAGTIQLESWTPKAEEPQEAPAAPPPGDPNFKANEILVPPGASLVPTAIIFPAGRDAEAKILTDKVERITPKFTKVAVVINVQAMIPYDKSDMKTSVLSQMDASKIKAVFMLVEKPLDDPRRKAMTAELESRGVYFQDIALAHLEKKAIYTDMLLGMVFFFDSQKPAGEAPAA
jgi:hypothetical protein